VFGSGCWREFAAILKMSHSESSRVSFAGSAFNWHASSVATISTVATTLRKYSVQPSKGEAKAYQIRQFLKLVDEYNLETRGLVMKDYHINIFWSEEDDCYVADIPDLKYCSAFGDSPEKALAEVLIAKQGWLEVARELGKPIPPPAYRACVDQSVS
jgi:predicted RNase H-like HicB family nuclease